MFWPFTPTCSWKCWKRSMVKLRGLINPHDSLKWVNSIRAIIKEVVAYCQTTQNTWKKKQNVHTTNASWEYTGNPHLTVIIRCLSRGKEAVRIWLPSQHDLWPGSHRPEENRFILCIYQSKEFSRYVANPCHFGNCYVLGPEEKKKKMSVTFCLFEIISELHRFKVLRCCYTMVLLYHVTINIALQTAPQCTNIAGYEPDTLSNFLFINFNVYILFSNVKCIHSLF